MLIFILGLISSAHACTYQLNQNQVHMGDRSIYFADYLHQKIQAHGYSISNEGESPEFMVDLALTTSQQGHFEHVQSEVSIRNVRDGSVFAKAADATCFTQSCTAKDGAKVIRKSIDDFGKNLPECASE